LTQQKAKRRRIKRKEKKRRERRHLQKYGPVPEATKQVIIDEVRPAGIKSFFSGIYNKIIKKGK